ncbi:MAG: S24 family peptidase, partial [bacterium]
HVGLVFLSLLYENLQLVSSDRLICREPTPLRRTIEEEQGDPGRLLSRLKSTIDRAREEIDRSSAPYVTSTGESLPVEPESLSRIDVNRYIPVIGIVEPGTDEIRSVADLDPLEIPRSWLEEGADYRAIQVRSDAFEGFGIWPGTTVLFEADAEPSANDIVVIKIDDRLTMMIVKMRMAGEEDLILQGGGRAAPVVYVSREHQAATMGVVRHFMSTFRDLKGSKNSNYSVREKSQ